MQLLWSKNKCSKRGQRQQSLLLFDSSHMNVFKRASPFSCTFSWITEEGVMVTVNSASVQRKHPQGKADRLLWTSWFFIEVTEVIVDKNADLATCQLGRFHRWPLKIWTALCKVPQMMLVPENFRSDLESFISAVFLTVERALDVGI